jgi:spermidine/putrescine transport system permease protein
MSRPQRALGALSALAYAFLYAPILVLVLFSFNRARLGSVWQGFTLDWYQKALANPLVLQSLRNSLLVALLATALCVAIGTAAALALHRHRFRREAALDALVTLPIVIPEIVMASSLLLLFGALRLKLSFLTVVLAHIAFSISYAVVVVRARLHGFDRSLEEAAMDLGAPPWRTFRHVTLPLIAPGVLAAALLVFALSIDDYVITSFVAGVGSTTLPVQIYSMVKSGISPEINAISTLLLVATALLLLAAHRVERGGTARTASLPAAVAVLLLTAPFLLGGGAAGGDKVLNLYIWSGYIAPETIKKFELRHGARVILDVYDTNEALLAKLETGGVGYDVICPSNYLVEILLRQGRLRALDRSALPNFANLDPRFVDLAHDPGTRHTVPYFWGVTGIAYDTRKVAAADSWGALWDERHKGRILMLDDPRETIGAALKWKGHSMNATDPRLLREARDLLVRQKPLVRTYDSSSFDDALITGDVWIEQAWNGQIAKAIDENPHLAFVVPKEGAPTYLDSLAIPADAPHPELAHAFLDFTLEAEIAAEICRTMKYSSPNRAALGLLPKEIRENPAIFPPPEVAQRLEWLRDIGEAVPVYERLWTEVKTSR